MKILFNIAILASLIISCAGSKTDSNQSNEEEFRIKVSKENIFENILSVINGKIEFDDITITYDDLIMEFSKEFRESFENDAGELFRDRIPEWREQSIITLSEVCDENDATISNTKIKLQKDDIELKAYTGEFIITCAGTDYFFRFSAFETINNFYVSLVNRPN